MGVFASVVKWLGGRFPRVGRTRVVATPYRDAEPLAPHVIPIGGKLRVWLRGEWRVGTLDEAVVAYFDGKDDPAARAREADPDAVLIGTRHGGFLCIGNVVHILGAGKLDRADLTRDIILFVEVDGAQWKLFPSDCRPLTGGACSPGRSTPP